MKYVLKNGIILDGTREMQPVSGMMIRIEDGKIKEIQPDEDRVSDCEVIDLRQPVENLQRRTKNQRTIKGCFRSFPEADL